MSSSLNGNQDGEQLLSINRAPSTWRSRAMLRIGF
jgi:hypothetical protein